MKKVQLQDSENQVDVERYIKVYFLIILKILVEMAPMYMKKADDDLLVKLKLVNQ